MPRSVYLLTVGDGSDGDAWDVLGIYGTREAAERAKAEHDQPGRCFANAVEEWEVQ